MHTAQVCDEKKLMQRLPECAGFIKGTLLNASRPYIEPGDLELYNRYQRDYEVCVLMITREVCDQTASINDESLGILKYTRDYMQLGLWLQESISPKAGALLSSYR